MRYTFDLITLFAFDRHLQSDGSCNLLLLRHPRLTPVAVPTIFPNLPSYLTKIEPARRTDPQQRRDNNFKSQQQQINAFLKSDHIQAFINLLKRSLQELTGWEMKSFENKIYIFKLNFESFNN